MRIALATCSKLPDWEVDDQPLHAALLARGVDMARPTWDDRAFDWSACDACLIRTTWDYTDRRDEYVDWARRVSKATRLFNPFDIVRWNTCKSYLRDLEARGIAVIPYLWMETGSSINLPSLLKKKGWKRAVLKPAIGATARETIRFEATDEGIQEANQHLDRLLANESMILQPYLPSVETEGELSIIMIDADVSHAVRKTPVAGDYRVQDDFGGSDRAVEISEKERKLARNIVDKIEGDWLYARIDLLRDGDGQLKLSELELVEPSLFFRHCPAAAERLADAVCRRLEM